MNSLLGRVISSLIQGFGLVSRIGRRHGSGNRVFGSPGTDRDESRQVPSAGLHHRQSGILYADIADYARLSEVDEDGTHLRLVEAMKLASAQVALNGGRVAHYAGDAMLAEFDDADSALHCAIDLQLAIREWNAAIDSERRVYFRIGVNFGDIISDRGDIYGNAVNLAARLEKLAVSGGICVSETVRREVEDGRSINFVTRGGQRLKNIGEPVDVFLIDLDSSRVIEKDFTCAVKVSTVAS